MSNQNQIRFSAYLFVAVAFAILTGSTNAELLFSDNFYTTASSTDINAGIGTPGNGRTDGKYETAIYTQSGTVYLGEEAQVYEYLRFPGNNTYPMIWLDKNFNNDDSAGGLDIMVRANPNVGLYKSSWFGLTIGGPASNVDPGANGLFIGLRGGTATNQSSPCEIIAFCNGTAITFDYTPVWSGNADGTSFHDFLFQVRGVNDNNPFDGVGQLHVALYIDGDTTLDVLDLTTPMGVVFSNNYIALRSNKNNKALFDSLSITQVQVPEPSTLALLCAGLAGLLAYAWRKRR